MVQMADVRYTSAQFRSLAVEALGTFFEDRGFQRASTLEQETSLLGSIVYRGEHVGFVFSFDVRDQVVSAQVVRVIDGRLTRNWEGGYSANVFGHLVKHTGYRGGPSASAKGKEYSNMIERQMAGWVALLTEAGQSLLDDRYDSLPVKS